MDNGSLIHNYENRSFLKLTASLACLNAHCESREACIRRRIKFIRHEFDVSKKSRRQAQREIRNLQRRYNRHLNARSCFRLLR